MELSGRGCGPEAQLHEDVACAVGGLASVQVLTADRRAPTAKALMPALLCEAARARFERGSGHESLGWVENHPSGWGARFQMTTV